MKKLFALLHSTLQSGKEAVLVSVVASSGSTPRGAGARMLVTQEGTITGTIGGGYVEHKCGEIAREVLKRGESLIELFRLHPNEIADLGMICGGEVNVYFHFIAAKDSKMLAVTEEINRRFRAEEQAWLITDITKGQHGAMGVCSKSSGCVGIDIPMDVITAVSGQPVPFQTDSKTYYIEELVRAERVYIMGGGHVAQALVPVLVQVDFRCVVVEDREEFARAEMFQGAKETKLVDMNDLSEICCGITEHDYVCVMTRGHKDDFQVLKQILKTPACYIGVIGSRRKSAVVAEKLKQCDFIDVDISRIKTPIGMDIMAETPAEIAVSITAELIAKRAEKKR